MIVKTDSGEFIIPKEKENYVVFSFSNLTGAFDIRVTDKGVAVYIPHYVRQVDPDHFRIEHATTPDISDEP